ncbi:MAG: hypothetical protein L0H96_05100 [Humibacillus sp.]|nr:hypothetical protein [Humibacillus sp.]MDN5776267.1 hypothetical protein [Humibacillus sp.]
MAAGSVVGLTWAAGFRGWMAQLAGESSTFAWSTMLLVLLPATILGGLVVWTCGRHAHSQEPSVWLVLSPALLAVALLDPDVFSALVHTGEGAGSLAVVATALAGGTLFSGTGRGLGRLACAGVWVSGMLLVLFLATVAAPLSTPRGAWVCVMGGALVALLSLASALPHRGGLRGAEPNLPWIGALAGLAWAASLRGLMAAVVGDDSTVSWTGTFVNVLVPGAAVGGLLGWAARERRRGRPRRLLVWAPLLFILVLAPGLLDLSEFFDSGVGGGAIGVPVITIVGAHALGGRRIVTRACCAVVFASFLVVWVITAPSFGGPGFAVTRPQGAWAMLLIDGLLVTAAMATAIPLRNRPAASARLAPAGIGMPSAS